MLIPSVGQVGMMLRGMGFQNDTPIFLAAGKIYKAEKYMVPLRQMFPFLQTKETLLSHEELKPFEVSFLFSFRIYIGKLCMYTCFLCTFQGSARQLVNLLVIHI